VQGFTGSGVQGFRVKGAGFSVWGIGFRIRGFKDSGIQGCRGAGVQGCKGSGVRVRRHGVWLLVQGSELRICERRFRF